ncbi:hypothetical protein GMOD_00002524 [Pyrenophora seminiperda CCB06]|uniref:Uncharacterized protein n=1 Tax=Pyrenophora seminiperda CCB06 TaxID=1302712 RepID=A0A3M7M2U8_9PLEO|nr:hypothetical protein GMOD_00002524 [Pyrenophora seminiperda CCB06]
MIHFSVKARCSESLVLNSESCVWRSSNEKTMLSIARAILLEDTANDVIEILRREHESCGMSNGDEYLHHLVDTLNFSRILRIQIMDRSYLSDLDFLLVQSLDFQDPILLHPRFDNPRAKKVRVARDRMRIRIPVVEGAKESICICPRYRWIVGRRGWVQNDVYSKETIAKNPALLHGYQLHHLSETQLALLHVSPRRQTAKKIAWATHNCWETKE